MTNFEEFYSDFRADLVNAQLSTAIMIGRIKKAVKEHNLSNTPVCEEGLYNYTLEETIQSAKESIVKASKCITAFERNIKY